MAECTEDLVSSIPKVTALLLEKVTGEKRSLGSASDESLKALHFIYGPPFLSALDLVDRQAVCHVTSSSGKSFYQVKSSAGLKYYTCRLEPTSFCSCPSFSFGNQAQHEDNTAAATLFCKHLLAVKISIAMETVMQESVTDEAFNEQFEEN